MSMLAVEIIDKWKHFMRLFKTIRYIKVSNYSPIAVKKTEILRDFSYIFLIWGKLKGKEIWVKKATKFCIVKIQYRDHFSQKLFEICT